MSRAEAIVREVSKQYATDTAGCADAKLACDEIIRRLKQQKRRAPKGRKCRDAVDS